MKERSSFRSTLTIVIIAILLYCGIQNYELLLKLGRSIIHLIFPFLMGGAIAFVINVPMRALEKKITPKGAPITSLRRAISYIVTLILLIGVIALALFVIIPQISSTIKLIVAQVPPAFASFQIWIYDKTKGLPNVQNYLDNLNLNWSSISSQAINVIKNAGTTLFASGISIVSGIIGGVTNFVIAFIFSIYILFQKEKLSEQAKKTLYAFLPESKADRTLYIGRLSNKIFSNFLSGQCIEACILGMMFFITLSIFRIHYAVLIGVVVALTALIPIFGAFIGMAVGAFLLVMVNPMQALWFLVISIVLQQIEGNLIYPRVVGGSIGLPSLWVLVAVSVGGSLFGVAGILIFIPFCSVCYALFREFIYKRLKSKNVSKDKWNTIPTEEIIEKKLVKNSNASKNTLKRKPTESQTNKHSPTKK